MKKRVIVIDRIPFFPQQQRYGRFRTATKIQPPLLWILVCENGVDDRGEKIPISCVPDIVLMEAVAGRFLFGAREKGLGTEDAAAIFADR